MQMPDTKLNIITLKLTFRLFKVLKNPTHGSMFPIALIKMQYEVEFYQDIRGFVEETS